MFPPGMARFLPAGAKLTFQAHYTPIGSVQQDQSKIGLVFADPDDVTHRVISSSAINKKFEIPPHAASHPVEAKSRIIPWDSRLMSMSPHMHLRGKAMQYQAIYPDETKQVLLDIPGYDFNWQTEYRLEKALALPEGSRIYAKATFDNSVKNLNNPDPDDTVTWGDQTWDEMMIGYFTIAVPKDAPVAMPESALLTPQGALAAANRKAERMFNKQDKNGDGEIAPEEAPAILRSVFSKVDTDNNGAVSSKEFCVAWKEYMDAT